MLTVKEQVRLLDQICRCPFASNKQHTVNKQDPYIINTRSFYVTLFDRPEPESARVTLTESIMCHVSVQINNTEFSATFDPETPNKGWFLLSNLSGKEFKQIVDRIIFEGDWGHNLDDDREDYPEVE